MKFFTVVLVSLTFTPLVWSAEDPPASQEVNISKLKELLSSSTESLEKEEDSSQVVKDSVLPAESKPELDPAETEEDASRDRAKKSYTPPEPPYPLEPYPATHHVSHVHSYVAKPAYVPPGPTYASSHITYTAPHPPPHFSPPYVHAPPFCIEIRPKVPTQAPFFVCEPPHKGVVSSVASSSSVQQHPGGYSPPYGRADEHQTHSEHEHKHHATTTSPPPPPATTPDQTTKAVTEKPKEESGSHEQKTEKPAPSSGSSAPRTVYGPSPYYPPGHHGGIYAPYIVPHPSPPVKPLPVPYYPPVHPPTYPEVHPPAYPPVHPPAYPPAHPPAYPPVHPPAYPPVHPPAYPPAHPPAYPEAHPPAYPPVYPTPYHPLTPLVLNCHVEPPYAAPPPNPIAMLHLFMRPAPGYPYGSYRATAQEDEKKDKEKDKKEKTSPKSSEGSSTPGPIHPSNKARDQQGGTMMMPQMRQWSMRADMDQEPTSIGIPLPNDGKMPGEEENPEECAESSPKMAEPGKMKVPVGSKRQASKEFSKSPVNSRMNYYMPGQSMA